MPKVRIFLALLVIFSLSAIEPVAAETKDYQYFIRVSMEKRTLFLHPVDNETQVLAAYPVAIPKVKNYPLPMHGEVISVEIDPCWYPLEEQREHYFEKEGKVLPTILHPGDPRNAMGKAKFNIQWESTTLPFKIHGTNDPTSIGKKITGGCIRLSNENVLILAKLLKNTKIKVRFEN